MSLKKIFLVVVRFGVGLTCMSNVSGFADNNSSAYIQWRGDYFGDEIDYFDYINSAAVGTVPQSLANSAFEVGASIGRFGTVNYGYIVNHGAATRNTQPFKISSVTRAHQIGFSKGLGKAFSHSWSFSSYLQYRSQGEEDIDCFERLGIVIGGNCSEADFRLIDGDATLSGNEANSLSVLSTAGQSRSALLQVTARRDVPFLGVVTHAVGLKASSIDFSFQSPLFDIESPFLLSSKIGGVSLDDVIGDVKRRSPQQVSWHEYVFSYEVGLRRDLTGNVSGGLDVTYYRVWRNEYTPNAGQPKINSNFSFAASVTYNSTKHWSFTLGAEAFTNYLLGVDEMAYNQTTARYFDEPYGRLIAEITFIF
ncbi:hypothetical protein N9H90_09935 [Pseudomonadales bacterium]|nr:hypothetical protein [Pseudomonadales bacterium]MDA9905544.1 hypothetical protein [Pseudomonadales bacterium]